MTIRYWIVGGEYEEADFRSLVPGTEKWSGRSKPSARPATNGCG